MPTIRVLIVDDHPVMRQGIRDLVAKDPEIEVVGETGSGSEALKMARETKPDVMLLDMQLQDMSGIQIAQALKDEGSRVRVLALSAHDDREYIEELLKSGAAGYLIKDEAPEYILEAVHGVAGGEKGWTSRRIITQLSKWQNDPTFTRVALTNRENQVLDQVTAGKTNREIAVILSISEKTVEKHLETIFRKLGVESRTGAAVWAARDEINHSE